MHPEIKKAIERDISLIINEPSVKSSAAKMFEHVGVASDRDTYLAYDLGFLSARFMELSIRYEKRVPLPDEFKEFFELLMNQTREIKKSL